MPFFDSFELTSPWANDLAWLADPAYDLPVDLTPYLPYRRAAYTSDALSTLQDWLKQLDQLPESPIRPASRLGLYFENLVAFWLEYCPLSNDQLLFRNKQIHGTGNNGSTRGELDFVVNSNGLIRHLEVAVKFYLREDNDTQRWSGPNSRDYLERKLRRMRNHQLPMGQDLEGTYKPEESVYWLKGILFDAWRDSETTPLRYCWVRKSQLSAFLLRENTLWGPLDKEHWLGATPTASLDPNALCSEVENRLHVSNGIMLVETRASPSKRRRTMVVRDEWPQ